MTVKKLIQVKEVMKGQFVEMDGLMTVDSAIQALVKEDAHTLIIKKRHEHDEYGIVVLADIAKKVLANDRSPERVNLYEIMTKPVLSVSPEMDIRYCARLFDQFGLSSTPVLDHGKVVGVITYEEIVLHGLVALARD
ncbi:CBS domain-containing protein [Aestuariirhabdus sp. Z084]|uniref:CBS domain-containing protein n=1 Tax=Aestuariirhabdus haliotis TaxID=2918751 RepID=UPI00201B3B7B|nr:CBS domain-containing protein [Aestuariirhabdus haliotis]MCL6416225.1 CBS domain-containing protein [Aestuariirhabdus haliotis]MCL6420315.1 CBS domain-containing protein [Aestuariirhabdus haliotis]